MCAIIIMRLLIASNDTVLADILSLSMKESGYKVDQAHDGFEAIGCLQKVPYDVVILDTDMPGMNGAEVCEFIRSDNPDTYVIVRSRSCKSLGELRDGGADICFIKPYVYRGPSMVKNLGLPLPVKVWGLD
ncbi:MAG TPA: response regulator [Syntrophales bacterium]|nr:response regulator [Syntrophales bacterium]